MDARYRDKREYMDEDKELAQFHEEEAGALGGIDMPFFILTILILTIGVIMVLSASFARAYIEDGNPTEYFIRQALFAIIGVAGMLIASRLPMALYRRVSMLSLAASIALLAVVPIIGVDAGGARRWIDLGFTTFQPSELAKLAVILSFAQMICVFKNKMKTVKYGILPFAGALAIIIGLLILEPHCQRNNYRRGRDYDVPRRS